MFVSALLGLISLLLLGLSIRLFYTSMRKTGRKRVLSRLGQGQPVLAPETNTTQNRLDRLFVRAGLSRPGERQGLWLGIWGLLVLVGAVQAGGVGLLLMLLLPPLALRLYLTWRYQRRVRRMVE